MPGHRLAGWQILVVEDDSILRAGILRILRGEGAHAMAVDSGEEAIEAIVEGWSFDIMLVDLALPGMDGAECAHLIRSMHRSVQGGRIDTIVGMSGDPERLRAQRDGFDGIVAKPFSRVDLLEELERLSLLQKSKTRSG